MKSRLMLKDSSIKMMLLLAFIVGTYMAQQINAHSVIRENDLVISYTGITRTTCNVEEYRFQAFVTNTITDCVIECALREHCQVLNYLLDYKLCELYQIKDPTNTTGKCYRVQKEDIRIHKSPCSGTCANGTTCDRRTKTCQIKECLEVPRLTNGRVRGNLRAVGNRIKYECDEGYILVNSSDQISTCLENGNWSIHGQCRQAAAYGEICSDTNCSHTGYRCLGSLRSWYNYHNSYCHCQFGYEYDQSSGTCKQVCAEYATNVTLFQRQASMALFGYDLGSYIDVESDTKCIDHCNTAYPHYLSLHIVTNGDNTKFCLCNSVSKKQYIEVHGPLPTNSAWWFYDRPCISPVSG